MSAAPSPEDRVGAAQPGRLFVVTGPSGAGKGTVIQALLERRPELTVAVSATTRPIRAGEVDGRDYHFMSEAAFDRKIAEAGFLEYVVYASGQRYGTLREEVDRILATGQSCVLELETQGARFVKASMEAAITVFIAAPTFSELRRRLVDRATESAGEIDERLELARRQMTESSDFDYVVVNDELERAVTELEEFVAAHLQPTGTLNSV